MISFLVYLSERIKRFNDALPDALQYRDPALLHPPLKAVSVLKDVIAAINYEMGLNTDEERDYIFQDLYHEFDRLLSYVEMALIYCSADGPNSHRGLIEFYKIFIRSSATKTDNIIKNYLTPLIDKDMAEAEAEYGQPMCIGIPSYPPVPMNPSVKNFLQALSTLTH